MVVNENISLLFGQPVDNLGHKITSELFLLPHFELPMCLKVAYYGVKKHSNYDTFLWCYSNKQYFQRLGPSFKKKGIVNNF